MSERLFSKDNAQPQKPTQKSMERTERDFRCPIWRPATGRADSLACARHRHCRRLFFANFACVLPLKTCRAMARERSGNILRNHS